MLLKRATPPGPCVSVRVCVAGGGQDACVVCVCAHFGDEGQWCFPTHLVGGRQRVQQQVALPVDEVKGEAVAHALGRARTALFSRPLLTCDYRDGPSAPHSEK